MVTITREALEAARKIVAEELESFIDSNSEHTSKGKRLDRKGLTGYELAALERLESAIALIDGALKVD